MLSWFAHTVLGGAVNMLPFLILGWFLALLLIAILMVVLLLRGQYRQARAFGYPGLGAYLRAAPQTDAEKRAAADLALKGAVICLLGFMFPPALLIGLFPFFYGARKLVYAQMGLGLLDDEEPGSQRGL
jgi:hypothetical protein